MTNLRLTDLLVAKYQFCAATATAPVVPTSAITAVLEDFEVGRAHTHLAAHECLSPAPAPAPATPSCPRRAPLGLRAVEGADSEGQRRDHQRQLLRDGLVYVQQQLGQHRGVGLEQVARSYIEDCAHHFTVTVHQTMGSLQAPVTYRNTFIGQ